MKIIFYHCTVDLPLDQPTKFIIHDIKGTFYIVSNQLTLGEGDGSRIELMLRSLESNAIDEYTTFFVPHTLKRLFFGQIFELWRDDELDKDPEIAQTKILALKQAILQCAQRDENPESIQFVEIGIFIPLQPKISVKPMNEPWYSALLETYLPASLLIVTLLLLVFLLKPDVSGVKISQIPEMLRKADQSLEDNIEETLYWAQDRILMVYKDIPNVKKSTDDEKEREAKALIEAATEVETAMKYNNYSKYGDSRREIATATAPENLELLTKRKHATESMLNSGKFTLKLGSKLTAEDMEALLREAPLPDLEQLYVVESKLKGYWIVGYGAFATMEEATKIPQNKSEEYGTLAGISAFVKGKCCESYSTTRDETIRKIADGKVGEERSVPYQRLFSVINKVTEQSIKRNAAYSAPKSGTCLCEFSKLPELPD